MNDNPNKIWVIIRPVGARNAEYYQYNSLSEALTDFDDWTLETDIIGCELMYRGVTLLQSFKGKVGGAACEQYHQNCARRDKLPDSAEILNCTDCVEKMIADHVL